MPRQAKTSLGQNKWSSNGHLSRTGNSRTSAVYWKSRLERTVSSTGAVNPIYSVRIAYQKRRIRFSLRSPNKGEASNVAAEIFSYLVGNGWEATIAKFKSKEGDEAGNNKPNNIGALIESACKHSTARDQSKAEYTKALRRIVSGVMGFDDNGCFESRNHSGNAKWRSAINEVNLAELTPARIQDWRSKFLDNADQDESTKRRAIITTNSLIRNARALFAKKLLPFLRESIELPTPLPFEDVSLLKQPSMRYRSKINARTIMEKAVTDLKPDHPEAYKILLLALVCGLRISEIDYLLWEAFDFEQSILRVEDSSYHRLKSEDSAGEIDLNDEMRKYFCECLNEASGDFVIESPREVKRNTGSRRYRCGGHINTLKDWLRSQGVTAPKPIHELRKEVGSIIANEQGIFAASRYLRHSDIRITSAIYADKKKKITPSFLSGNEL